MDPYIANAGSKQLRVAHEVWATQATIEPFIKPKALQDGAMERFGQPVALADVLQQLQQGTLKPSDLPAIRVVEHEDRLYSLDNRRLWLFHQVMYTQPCSLAWHACAAAHSSSPMYCRTACCSATADPLMQQPPLPHDVHLLPRRVPCSWCCLLSVAPAMPHSCDCGAKDQGVLAEVHHDIWGPHLHTPQQQLLYGSCSPCWA